MKCRDLAKTPAELSACAEPSRVRANKRWGNGEEERASEPASPIKNMYFTSGVAHAKRLPPFFLSGVLGRYFFAHLVPVYIVNTVLHKGLDKLQDHTYFSLLFGDAHPYLARRDQKEPTGSIGIASSHKLSHTRPRHKHTPTHTRTHTPHLFCIHTNHENTRPKKRNVLPFYTSTTAAVVYLFAAHKITHTLTRRCARKYILLMMFNFSGPQHRHHRHRPSCSLI